MIYEGALEMQEIAQETLSEMRKAMGLSGVWNRISRRGRDWAKKQESSVQGS